MKIVPGNEKIVPGNEKIVPGNEKIVSDDVKTESETQVFNTVYYRWTESDECYIMDSVRNEENGI